MCVWGRDEGQKNFFSQKFCKVEKHLIEWCEETRKIVYDVVRSRYKTNTYPCQKALVFEMEMVSVSVIFKVARLSIARASVQRNVDTELIFSYGGLGEDI